MDEYIKREDAVKAAFDCTDSLEPPIVNTTVKLVAMKIQDIPPEDVRSIVHGKWIPRILPLNHAGNECSACLAISVGAMKTKYCPNCGAKMDDKDINVPCKTKRERNRCLSLSSLQKQNEEMQEVANKDAFYGEALND